MKATTIHFLLFILLGGCSLFGLNESSSNGPDDVIELVAGDSISLPALDATVRFVEKAQDSRCPITQPGSEETLNCVWEGEVEIVLAVAQSSQAPTTFSLIGYVGPEGKGTVAKDTLGLHFTLLSVDPFPIYPPEDPANDAPLKISLRVERM